MSSDRKASVENHTQFPLVFTSAGLRCNVHLHVEHEINARVKHPFDRSNLKLYSIAEQKAQ